MLNDARFIEARENIQPAFVNHLLNTNGLFDENQFSL